MKRPLLFSLFFLLIAQFAEGHSMAYDFSSISKGDLFWEYLKLGFQHILPLGFDHILFVLGIFLLKPKLRSVLLQVTCFTIAHSITLALAINGYISPPSGIIEPLIALSIVFIGIENILFKELKWWRLIIVFMFGLIHGCGFAGVLSEIGLPEKDFLSALVAFNIGVEAGQTAVILLAVLIFQTRFADRPWYRNRVTIPVSVCISLIAVYWTIERVFYS
ncbi:MAG: HupE/UreJ family protein [Bacteroidota bacterium]